MAQREPYLRAHRELDRPLRPLERRPIRRVEDGRERRVQRLQNVRRLGGRRLQHRHHQLVPRRRVGRLLARPAAALAVVGLRLGQVRREPRDAHALAHEQLRRRAHQRALAAAPLDAASLRSDFGHAERRQHRAKGRADAAVLVCHLEPHVHVGHVHLELLQQRGGEPLLPLEPGLLAPGLDRLPRLELLALGARHALPLVSLAPLTGVLWGEQQEEAVDADDQRRLAQVAPGHLDANLAERAADHAHREIKSLERLRLQLERLEAHVAIPHGDPEALLVDAVHKGA